MNNEIDSKPMRCPRCGEITLVAMESGPDLECTCENCRHYEIHVNPDYDPTPDEAGEPPVSIQERCNEALNAPENGRGYVPVHLRNQAS